MQIDPNINPKRLTIGRRLARGLMATETVIAMFASTGLVGNLLVQQVLGHGHTGFGFNIGILVTYAFSLLILVADGRALIINITGTDNEEYNSIKDISARRKRVKDIFTIGFTLSSIGFHGTIIALLSTRHFWSKVANWIWKIGMSVMSVLFITLLFCLAYLAYVILYYAIKWIVWNGYMTDFVGLTISQNVKRIQRVPGLGNRLSVYSNPKKIAYVVHANRKEIMKYRKWYEMY